MLELYIFKVMKFMICNSKSIFFKIRNIINKNVVSMCTVPFSLFFCHWSQ